MKYEYQLLNKVNELLEKEKLEHKEYLLWLAHFASLQTTALSPTATTSLFPLFEDSAPCINPGQTSIIGMDQPIYNLAKRKMGKCRCLWEE